MIRIIPKSTWLRLGGVWLVTVLFMLLEGALLAELSPVTATIAFAVLLTTIIVAAFGVVREADALAHKLGEPYGTLILTLSIVAIEVILISAVMLGPGEHPTIGKDSIFSVMMIIMNLVIGLCVLVGAWRYGEQEYNAQGTMSYLGMIIMLGGLGMMLPNFIQGAGGGAFTAIQAGVLSVLIILLYGLFLAFQMTRYRHLYVQPPTGSMEILFANRHAVGMPSADAHSAAHSQTGMSPLEPTPINRSEVLIRSLILIAMVLPIVLLSHHMAVVVDYGIAKAQLPPVLGGVLIAIIVFTPESITAVKAAYRNEFQRAINLCHGAFVSTVGLSVPAVLLIGLLTGKTVLFGMTGTETILFMITLLLSVMSFLGKRTTLITGIMHLVLFAVFILLIFNP